MPYLHESLAKQRALAEAPTLGNLHPDARAQAIARAGIAEAEAMRETDVQPNLRPCYPMPEGNHG